MGCQSVGTGSSCRHASVASRESVADAVVLVGRVSRCHGGVMACAGDAGRAVGAAGGARGTLPQPVRDPRAGRCAPRG